MSRIPKYQGREDLLTWLSSLHDQGRLFHPDDDPADIINLQREAVFTPTEVDQLNAQIPLLLDHWGEELYKAMTAYSFLNRG